MSQLEFADDVLSRIRDRAGPYDLRAYLFVLAALERLQGSLPERRHVSGEELARACRDFALEQYGLLSRTVLEHWGVRETDDIGRVVFTLIDVGLLKAQDGDRLEDFRAVFAFTEAFERTYPWGAWRDDPQ
jgi:uncharacterized repeat protein (TIGR04138 family)